MVSDGYYVRGIPKFLCWKCNKCFLLHKKFVAKCILICDPKTLIFSQVLSTFASSHVCKCSLMKFFTDTIIHFRLVKAHS